MNFLNITKGSAGKLRSLLRVALEVEFLKKETYIQIYTKATQLSRMLFNQIQVINQSFKKQRRVKYISPFPPSSLSLTPPSELCNTREEKRTQEVLRRCLEHFW